MSDVALAVAAALHAGFQLTVTLLVYPALVEVGPEAWDRAHERHSRRIVPLVGVVYAGLLAAGIASVLAGPDVVTWLALALLGGTVVVTGALAAPLHSRLGPETHQLRARLLVIDRIRCSLAVAGAIMASLALW